MSTTTLLVPGWSDSGPEHWQSLWERAHPTYQRVRQRDWVCAARVEWVAALDRAVVAAAGPVVLVAHSLGCHTVAHWLAHPSALTSRVRGALLVAPPDLAHPAWPSTITGFAPLPLQRLLCPSIVVASTNDPWDPRRSAERLAAAWGSRFVSAGASGHINTEAGFGPWPAGERLLAEL